ncbi:hypothetical protein DFH08DRAFT_801223 [Mycena albidolilacea]|uniref:Uncharacterized protein n=1 Tax=Mycena albidolilacea TaxID=1033008 RepID=A0AAD7AI42_9AGAR|nr:hypothetical protein DFH08DRAFT_801223 [Mycena albidolilacea]
MSRFQTEVSHIVKTCSREALEGKRLGTGRGEWGQGYNRIVDGVPESVALVKQGVDRGKKSNMWSAISVIILKGSTRCRNQDVGLVSTKFLRDTGVTEGTSQMQVMVDFETGEGLYMSKKAKNTGEGNETYSRPQDAEASSIKYEYYCEQSVIGFVSDDQRRARAPKQGVSLRLDPKFAKAAYASKSGDGELIAFLVAQDLDAL